MRHDMRELRNAVMKELKLRCGAHQQVHHIFGRVGRLQACRYFCVNLGVPEGGANHHDLPPQVLKRLRDENRADFLSFEAANVQNLDPTSCWYRCVYHQVCQLYERAP